jgi:hypothetical protein
VIVPTSPPAGWYADPAGSEGQRYWDGASWTKHSRAGRPAPPSGLTALGTRVRRRWGAVPVVLRLVIPIVLAVTLVVVGFGFWATSPRDDWAALPSRLNCQTENGPKPPGKITVSSVEVKHPRNSVLQLIIRFDEALPPSPTGTYATKFVGYVLTYSVANNGTKFAELGPEQGTDDLAITRTLAATSGEARTRADRDTYARRSAPDTIDIQLDLKRLGIDNQPVSPDLTLRSQFDTPSTTTVQFATQVCRG